MVIRRPPTEQIIFCGAIEKNATLVENYWSEITKSQTRPTSFGVDGLLEFRVCVSVCVLCVAIPRMLGASQFTPFRYAKVLRPGLAGHTRGGQVKHSIFFVCLFLL